MDAIKTHALKFEEKVERAMAPVKGYLPTLGRFLLVVTFFEDSLRIVAQWSDQTNYLEFYRGMWPWFSRVFLIANVVAMMVCSCLAIARRHTEWACAGLAAVVVSQAIGYGMYTDVTFMFRNMSLIGGLLMLLSESMASKKSMFPGLPELSETERSTYISAVGRILLVFLFFGLAFGGEFSVGRLVVSVFSLLVCVLVIIGFQAKRSAVFLLALLLVSNVVLNNW